MLRFCRSATTTALALSLLLLPASVGAAPGVGQRDQGPAIAHDVWTAFVNETGALSDVAKRVTVVIDGQTFEVEFTAFTEGGKVRAIVTLPGGFKVSYGSDWAGFTPDEVLTNHIAHARAELRAVPLAVGAKPVGLMAVTVMESPSSPAKETPRPASQSAAQATSSSGAAVVDSSDAGPGESAAAGAVSPAPGGAPSASQSPSGSVSPASSAPSGDNSGPGSANSGPGSANSGPGSANSGPGSANSGPGSADSGSGSASSGAGSESSGTGGAGSGSSGGSAAGGSPDDSKSSASSDDSKTR